MKGQGGEPISLSGPAYYPSSSSVLPAKASPLQSTFSCGFGPARSLRFQSRDQSATVVWKKAEGYSNLLASH